MNLKNKITNWLWKYANSETSSSQEDEEFGEMLKDYKKRLDKIKEIYHPKDNDELKQVALSFENAYSQRKIIQANNGLKWATWILALATIAFAVKEIWGAETANYYVQVGVAIVKVIIIILIIGIGVMVVNNIIKSIIKFFMKRIKHIWCVKCGRIITEYEEEGDTPPAFTLCPECFAKKNKK